MPLPFSSLHHSFFKWHEEFVLYKTSIELSNTNAWSTKDINKKIKHSKIQLYVNNKLSHQPRWQYQSVWPTWRRWCLLSGSLSGNSGVFWWMNLVPQYVPFRWFHRRSFHFSWSYSLCREIYKSSIFSDQTWFLLINVKKYGDKCSYFPLAVRWWSSLGGHWNFWGARYPPAKLVVCFQRFELLAGHALHSALVAWTERYAVVLNVLYTQQVIICESKCTSSIKIEHSKSVGNSKNCLRNTSSAIHQVYLQRVLKQIILLLYSLVTKTLLIFSFINKVYFFHCSW